MALNKGKAFEAKFLDDFSKLKDVSIDRIYDSVSGYKTISNISDFICYHSPNIFYVECKSILGNTFNLAGLRQYNKLVKKVGIPGVRTGVIIWFRDHDKVVYVPTSEVTKMKADGVKSVHIKYLTTQEYKIIEIPSRKRITYLDSDYSVLFNLNEGE